RHIVEHHRAALIARGHPLESRPFHMPPVPVHAGNTFSTCRPRGVFHTEARADSAGDMRAAVPRARDRWFVIASGHDRKLFGGCRRSGGCIERRTRRPYPWVWTTRTTPRGAIWARQTLGELSVVTARPAPALAEAGGADLRTDRPCRLVR